MTLEKCWPPFLAFWPFFIVFFFFVSVLIVVVLAAHPFDDFAENSLTSEYPHPTEDADDENERSKDVAYRLQW